MTGHGKILQTEDLAIGYKTGKKVFDNICVSAEKAELIALFGPNGAGKSTLLRNLAGLQTPLSGEILLYGEKLKNYSRSRLSRILGYVSTEFIPVNNLRVKDLVSFGRYPHTGWMGRLGKNDIMKVDNAIDMVSIRHLKDKYIHQISDGERQRTMVARTLAQDTGIIILDEPTAFLDLPNKYEVVHLLHKLARESGKTIIFSTHDLNIAIQEADKIWLMLGEKMISGSPEDLILEGSFGKMFENTSLKFSRTKGEFGITRKFTAKISLMGPKTESRWTRNALERMGFGVVDDPAVQLQVVIHKKENLVEWELTFNKRKKQFWKIYDLCYFLADLGRSQPAGRQSGNEFSTSPRQTSHD